MTKQFNFLKKYGFIGLIGAGVLCLSWMTAQAESPELSMRELASGQIKKGVRSIGFGGDGATWGNYGLVWKDAGTVLMDGGDTRYLGGNDFHFSAVGFTTPPLWHDLAIYVIALNQDTNTIYFNAKSPGLGAASVPLRGTGNDRAIFTKVAMPVTDTISAGVLMSYETSHFSAAEQTNSSIGVRYETRWRPSGGFGVAWQPEKTMLFGFRALFNNDQERRIDSSGVATAPARSAEYRLGGSIFVLDDTMVDVGGTRIDRFNGLANAGSTHYYPNIGIEQMLLDRRLTVRAGLDETSPTMGITYVANPLKIDAAYVRDMAHDRVGNVFGTESNSFIVTVTLDYQRLFKDGN